MKDLIETLEEYANGFINVIAPPEEDVKELLEHIYNQDKEIERLNNIINGMEKFFQYAYDNEVRPLNDRKVSVWTICLDKLQELKGSDSNGQ